MLILRRCFTKISECLPTGSPTSHWLKSWLEKVTFCPTLPNHNHLIWQITSQEYGSIFSTVGQRARSEGRQAYIYKYWRDTSPNISFHNLWHIFNIPLGLIHFTLGIIFHGVLLEFGKISISFWSLMESTFMFIETD